ncbi:hypothetical protein ACVWW4_004041 [Bradyrhizobium sp. LB7.1]
MRLPPIPIAINPEHLAWCVGSAFAFDADREDWTELREFGALLYRVQGTLRFGHGAFLRSDSFQCGLKRQWSGTQELVSGKVSATELLAQLTSKITWRERPRQVPICSPTRIELGYSATIRGSSVCSVQHERSGFDGLPDRSQAARRTRRRNSVLLARPYICRLMALIRLIWPSTGLAVQEVVIAARTASMSRAMPLAKLLSSLLPACAIHSSRSAMSLPLRRDTTASPDRPPWRVPELAQTGGRGTAWLQRRSDPDPGSNTKHSDGASIRLAEKARAGGAILV